MPFLNAFVTVKLLFHATYTKEQANNIIYNNHNFFYNQLRFLIAYRERERFLLDRLRDRLRFEL